MTGVDAAGAVTCAVDVDTNTTYDGTDFATSNQSCGAGERVTGIAADGSVTCAADVDTNTTYTAGAGLVLASTSPAPAV